MDNRLALADLLLIAEAVLGVPAEQLQWVVPLGAAEAALAAPFLTIGGTDFHPDPVDRAAICCSRIVRSRPFPSGNAHIAYECMLEMLARAGVGWPRLDPAAVATIVEKLGRHEISEEEFVRWIRVRTEADAG
jgi:prophage maintenance system killer protein